MAQAAHNKIVSCIADDGLRDLFVRGKYPDVILPMFVLRRCDAVLEPTKKEVLETKTMLEDGGIEAFLEREVLLFAPDAGVDETKTQIGYEVSFTRHFYKPQKLRTLEEIAADIIAVQKEAEGLLDGLVKRGRA
jgi:type I restriction enzyme M protein